MESLTFDVLIQWWSFWLVALVLWFFLTKFDKALSDQKEILISLKDTIDICKSAMLESSKVQSELISKLLNK